MTIKKAIEILEDNYMVCGLEGRKVNKQTVINKIKKIENELNERINSDIFEFELDTNQLDIYELFISWGGSIYGFKDDTFTEIIK